MCLHNYETVQIKKKIDQLCITFMFRYNNVISLVLENSMTCISSESLVQCKPLSDITNSAVVYYLQQILLQRSSGGWSSIVIIKLCHRKFSRFIFYNQSQIQLGNCPKCLLRHAYVNPEKAATSVHDRCGDYLMILLTKRNVCGFFFGRNTDFY